MIITDVENIKKYSEILGGNFTTAINAILDKRFEQVESGKHLVDGDNVFCAVNKYNTKNYYEAKYETHKKYIDIQVMVSGREYIYCKKPKDLEFDGEYSVEKDKQDYKNSDNEDVVLDFKPGDVAFFYPEDAHKVGCIYGDQSIPVVKLVFKVLI